MSQAPSMPMFWDAYLADTTHLSTEEHGAYLLLLGAMWRRNGSVPDDDRDLARIVGLPMARWRKTKARLAALLIIDDGEVSQKNLQKIWKITQEKIATNRENGRLGGRPKTKENNYIDKPNGSVSPNPNDNRNETIPEPEPNTDNTDTNVSDAGVDFAKVLFENGVAFLGRHGTPERQARSLIGKWRKEHSDRAVFDAFSACSKAGATDPVPWITARLAAQVATEEKTADVWAEVERRLQ